MRRLFLYWIAIGLATLLGAGAVSALVFRRIDLSFPVFFQLLVLPAFQAAVLLWVRREWSFGGIAARLAASLRVAPVAWLLALDAIVIGVALAFPGSHPIGPTTPARMQVVWAGLKAMLAAALFATLAIRRARGPERLWYGLVALGLGVLGLEPLRPWLAALPRLTPSTWPILLRWLASWCSLYVVVILGTALTGVRIARRNPLAGFWLDAVLALGALAGVIVALNIFLLPTVPDSWLGALKAIVSLAATGVVVAPLIALRRLQPPPLRVPTAAVE